MIMAADPVAIARDLLRCPSVTPAEGGAPLSPPGGGYHWYLVPRVGTPDPDTFDAAFANLAELHDELWRRTGLGPERPARGRLAPLTQIRLTISVTGEGFH